jgi:hypothetical protein
MSYCSPANIYGPLPQATFFGCSVVSFSTSIGWNEQSSELTVKLVEDCNQTFSHPKIGTPHTFTMGDFKFRGILESWIESRDSGGNPIYTVKLGDPRIILDGVQLIVGDYYGRIADNEVFNGTAPFNLFNIAGYIDNTASSQDNAVNCPSSPALQTSKYTNRPRGIPWNRIKTAIGQLINGSGSSDFCVSKYIEYIGENANSQYTLDISEVPSKNDETYTISGPIISVSELLSQLATDGGFDYYITLLDNNTIKVKTVFRGSNPPLDKIEEFVGATGSGPNRKPTRPDVISYSHGRELRNEASSAFYTGSKASIPVITSNTSSFLPYWGGEYNENAAINIAYQASIQNIFGSPAWVVQLPSEGVDADLSTPIGGFILVSELEIRASLASFDSWMSMAIEIAKAGGPSTLGSILISNNFKSHFVNIQSYINALAGRAPAIDAFLGMKRNIINDIKQKDAQAMFSFIQKYAQSTYGSQFLIPAPSIYQPCPIVDNSLYPTVKYTLDPDTGGAWTEGSLPELGLGPTGTAFFADSTGKTNAFLVFSLTGSFGINNTGPYLFDTTSLNKDDFLILGSSLYIKAQLDTTWVLIGQTYYGLLSISPAIAANLANSNLGKNQAGLALINPVLAANLPQAIPTIELGSFVFGAAGQALAPQGAFYGIRDNLRVYGPLGYRAPFGGKVQVQSDDGFNPWSYGDTNTMLQGMSQKLFNDQVGQMTEIERGSVQVAGFPEISLGESLIAQGPTVTQINCEIGSNGFTTDYQFSTYTPQFGRFTKQNSERLKEIGQSRLKLKQDIAARALRSNQIGQQRFINAYENNVLGSRSAPRSAHTVLVGRYIDVENNPNKKRVEVNTQSNMEFTAGISEVAFPNTAFMSWDGLIRPVSKTGSGGLPRYPSGIPTGFPNRINLDPFQIGHDIEVLGQGNGFQEDGITTERLGYNNDIRFMALRGPLVIGGWGYDTNGYPIPNVQDSGAPSGVFESGVSSGDFYSGYLSNANTWPVAPVDMRFDRERHVWVAGGGGGGGCNEVVFQIDCVEGTSAGEFNDLVVSGRIIGIPCGCTEIPGSVTDDSGICRIRVHDMLHCLWREDSSETSQAWLGQRGFAHYIQPFNPSGCQPKDEPCVWAIHSLCCPNPAFSEPGVSYRGAGGPPVLF